MYNFCEQDDSPYDACVTGLRVTVSKIYITDRINVFFELIHIYNDLKVIIHIFQKLNQNITFDLIIDFGLNIFISKTSFDLYHKITNILYIYIYIYIYI